MKKNVTEAMEGVGDHPILDFLNTVSKVDGELVDALQSDADVLLMMARVGWALPKGFVGMGTGKLLREARVLREEVRGLISARKSGKRLALGALNRALVEARSVVQVAAGKDGVVTLQRVWEQQNVAQVLGPLAEAAASLLAEGDFDLVRGCEDESCVLWFYDRTKSHRRRWCSMAACGNRHKVAAFRKRQGES